MQCDVSRSRSNRAIAQEEGKQREVGGRVFVRLDIETASTLPYLHKAYPPSTVKVK